jgi:hypothetical protein
VIESSSLACLFAERISELAYRAGVPSPRFATTRGSACFPGRSAPTPAIGLRRGFGYPPLVRVASARARLGLDTSPSSCPRERLELCLGPRPHRGLIDEKQSGRSAHASPSFPPLPRTLEGGPRTRSKPSSVPPATSDRGGKRPQLAPCLPLLAAFVPSGAFGTQFVAGCPFDARRRSNGCSPLARRLRHTAGSAAGLRETRCPLSARRNAKRRSAFFVDRQAERLDLEDRCSVTAAPRYRSASTTSSRRRDEPSCM